MRLLTLATPLVIALVTVGCSLEFGWDDDCDWFGECGTPDICSEPGFCGNEHPSGGAGQTICVPGSTRYCDTAVYCSWGVQTCNDRGDGWSTCYETSPPSGCSGFSYDQQCCVDSNSCCQDWFDFDGDGDFDESIGNCEEVLPCDDDSDCPSGYCEIDEDGSGQCIVTNSCGNDEDCAELGSGFACDERGICIPEEAPCPSGHCGCISDSECESELLCIDSRCTDPNAVCFFDFECGESSVCLNNACHAGCTEGTCPTGQTCSAGMCIDLTTGTDGCVFDEDCAGLGDTCINATCFSSCSDSAQCSDGESCQSGVCRADFSPAHECDESTACPTDMLCSRGICRLPCASSINCCGELSECGPENFCMSPAEMAPECTRQSDCSEGLSCLSNTCSSLI